MTQTNSLANILMSINNVYINNNIAAALKNKTKQKQPLNPHKPPNI